MGFPAILVSYSMIYVMRKKLQSHLKIYFEKIFQILILITSIGITAIVFKYYFFPPEINIQKYGGDIYHSGYVIYAYHDNTLYPQARCYLDDKNEIMTYLDLNLANLTDQSIDIRNVKINIKDYQNSDPFRFQINRVIGGDGGIKDHIYFGKLISNREENYLSYCGDEEQSVVFEPDYCFEPSEMHVKILPKDYDYFFLVFKFDQPGIYKFTYELEYMIHGEMKSEESKIFSWYMPSMEDFLNDDIQNIDADHLETISSPDVAYLAGNIDDIFDNNKQSSRKVRKAVESLMSQR